MDFDQQLFLKHFHKNKNLNVSSSPSLRRNEQIHFMLCFDEQGLAYVKVVDKKGVEVRTDYRLYTDELFNVLRAIDKAREEMREKIVWGEENERVYLYQWRWVLYELVRCNNIVDEQMRPLQVSDTTLQLRLHISQNDKGEYATAVDVYGDGIVADKFQLIADNFVLATGSFISRGLKADFERVYEPILGVDVDADADPEQWTRFGVLQPQAYFGYGVATDNQLRCLKQGKPIQNLRAIGSVLSGHDAVKMGDGTGVSLLTAIAAADQIRENK